MSANGALVFAIVADALVIAYLFYLHTTWASLHDDKKKVLIAPIVAAILALIAVVPAFITLRTNDAALATARAQLLDLTDPQFHGQLDAQPDGSILLRIQWAQRVSTCNMTLHPEFRNGLGPVNRYLFDHGLQEVCKEGIRRQLTRSDFVQYLRARVPAINQQLSTLEPAPDFTGVAVSIQYLLNNDLESHTIRLHLLLLEATDDDRTHHSPTPDTTK